MSDVPDLTTPGSWPQTESLLLLRQVMQLGADVRHSVSERAALTETELMALEHLSVSPRGPAEIARLLDVTTAASTGIVDRLVAKGHAQRRPHAHDRRRTDVVITDHARGEVLRLLGPMFRHIAVADAALTEAEREVVARYLRAAVEAARVVTEGEQGAGHSSGH